MPATYDLLRATWLDRPDALTAFTAWQAAVDLNRLPSGQHALLPPLYHNLERLGIEHPWLGRLRGIYRRTWYTNQLMLQAADSLLGALAAAGVPVMLADDAALALVSYGERLRPIDSLGLVVPAARAAEAGQVLAGQQWSSAAGDALPFSPERRTWDTHQPYVSPQGQRVVLWWRTAPGWPSDAADAAGLARLRPSRSPVGR